MEMPDTSHLSDRAREKLEAEMQSGRDRTQAHRKAVQAAERAIAKQNREDAEEGVSAEELVARRAAAERNAEDRARDAQEAAVKANAEKEALDYNESIGIQPAVSDKVSDEAETLVSERQEQDREVEENPSLAEEQEDAAQANAEKEVQDRVESANNQGDTVFMGTNEPVDTGPRYDDDGNLIENVNADRVNETVGGGVEEDGIHPADIHQEKQRRGRPKKQTPTPAQPLGTGPKSE